MGVGAGLSGAASVRTIGHSTRALDDLIALLQEFGVGLLIDVRRYPGSRRYPHFSRDTLSIHLQAIGVGYRHEPDLGGRRSPRPDSPNVAWRSAAFRGYADHMASEEFQSALQRLIGSLPEHPAVMCAEAVPWRCHRQLIADAIVARGLEVSHILGAGQSMPHALNPHARVTPTGQLLYDTTVTGLLPLFSRSRG